MYFASASVWLWSAQRLTRYRSLLVALLALSAAEILLRVTAPWALKAIVDYVFGHTAAPAWLATVTDMVFHGSTASGSVRLLLMIGALGLVAHVAHQVVLWVHTRAYAVLGQLLTRDLRNDLFWHLQRLTLAHHMKNPAADAVYRLNSDATCVEQLVLRAAIPAVSSAATLLVMFVVLVGINAWLALVSLAIVPGLWLSLRVHSRRVEGEAARVKGLESRAMERAQETLSVIRLVKTFAREPYERERFAGATRHAARARIELTRREAQFSFVVGALTTAGTTLVLVVGGSMVLSGTITQGTLLLVLAYLGFIYGPLTAMSHSTAVIREALASAGRIREVLTVTPEPVCVPGRALPVPRVAGAIEFDRVSFAYTSDRPVLRDISFRIAPGEFVALVGPSGSGKTTITSLLTRLYEPSHGGIAIDGLDSTSYPLRELRQQIAVVIQDAVLLSGSIYDNLRYGRLDASDAEVEQAARDACAHDFIRALPEGYSTELGAGGTQLSGGERQRLSIARAFLKNAPILVLDEPTSALDAVSEARLVGTLDRLRAGRTTIVIAHRLSTVRRADRILVLDAGRVVATGTHETLLASSPLYAKLTGELVADSQSVDATTPASIAACA